MLSSLASAAGSCCCPRRAEDAFFLDKFAFVYGAEGGLLWTGGAAARARARGRRTRGSRAACPGELAEVVLYDYSYHRRDWGMFAFLFPGQGTVFFSGMASRGGGFPLALSRQWVIRLAAEAEE